MSVNWEPRKVETGNDAISVLAAVGVLGMLVWFVVECFKLILAGSV